MTINRQTLLMPLFHASAKHPDIAETCIAKRLAEINALKDRPVILVCRTDKRSASAAALLCDAGFRDVGVLRGGMEQWNQKGLPVDRHAELEHTGVTVAPVEAALREPE